MTTGEVTLCEGCSRLTMDSAEVGEGVTTGVCTAYPRGIPIDIFTGADHRTPRGDEVGGLVYDEMVMGHEALWITMHDE